jgi:putative toxin-antitoxin system antitoxin component (TIGR02293 family)
MSPITTLRKSLGFKNIPEESFKLHEMILTGVKKDVVTTIKECLDLTIDELAQLLPISKRQLQRYTKDSILSLEDTEHVIALADVILSGYQVFDSPKEFKEWVDSPNVSLQGKPPLMIMKTIYGCGLVKTVIERALHGIYS